MSKNMQLQNVTFPQAIRLKENGFDWMTDEAYDTKGKFCAMWVLYDIIDVCYRAPTVALALKWYRDVMGIAGGIIRLSLGGFGFACDIESRSLMEKYDTYEDAESALLDAVQYEVVRRGK